MTKLENITVKNILNKLDEQSHNIDQIVRGLYGDEKNKVTGLLERQDNDEAKWLQLAPILENADKIPKMVQSYNFWTSRATWMVIIFILSTIGTTILKWGEIQAAIF